MKDEVYSKADDHIKHLLSGMVLHEPAMAKCYFDAAIKMFNAQYPDAALPTTITLRMLQDDSQLLYRFIKFVGVVDENHSL